MEIGSELNLNLNTLFPTKNNIYTFLNSYNYSMYDCGRSALKSIPVGSGKILLPEFLCESIVNCFPLEQIVFYKLTNNLTIDIDDITTKINSDVSAVLFIHYFGALQSSKILVSLANLCKQNRCLLIEDTTQSIFSTNDIIGDYAICSIRKWFPISDGGILYCKKDRSLPSINSIKKNTDQSRLTAMILKDLYISKSLDCNSMYRNIFETNESKLDNQFEIMLMSDLSEYILSCMDIQEMIKKRQHNFCYLQDKLLDINVKPIVEFSKTDCPFVLPIMVKNRDNLRRYLISHQIYCAVHWPFFDEQEENRSFAYNLSNTIISLPIDQRYSDSEMDYLFDTVHRYGGELSF